MKLSVIGCGHMGFAIISGAVGAGVLKPSDITAADKFPDSLKKAEALGVRAASPADAVKTADAIILAVKPNDLAALAEEIADKIPSGAIIVSICAGKKLSTLESLFGDRKIIRVMPNTPALVGLGMSALCQNKNVSADEMAQIAKIFESFGLAETVSEELFDTVTAVSGSGPAYVYAFIEALAKFAAENGMTPEQGKLFAAQTVLGAAKMTLESSETPQKLKENVCSPGGTTIEAVKVLDERGFGEIISDAARACKEKSELLGKI